MTVAKRASHYVCQACGTSYAKWNGRCEACGEWNSLVEESLKTVAPGGLGSGRRRGKALAFHAPQASQRPAQRAAEAPQVWQT